MEARCYRRLLNIFYKDHVTNEEFRNRIIMQMECATISQPWWRNGNSDGMATSADPILWHGEDSSAGYSERSKKERKTEQNMGR